MVERTRSASRVGPGTGEDDGCGNDIVQMLEAEEQDRQSTQIPLFQWIVTAHHLFFAMWPRSGNPSMTTTSIEHKGQEFVPGPSNKCGRKGSQAA